MSVDGRRRATRAGDPVEMQGAALAPLLVPQRRFRRESRVEILPHFGPLTRTVTSMDVGTWWGLIISGNSSRGSDDVGRLSLNSFL